MAVFTNQATLTYNGNVINSNIATGELVEVISATKTAVLDTYTQGSDITYVIQIVNSGTSAVTGLTITDNLGSYPWSTGNVVPLDYMRGSVRLYTNGVLETAPVVNAGPPLVISGINVPAGGVATIIYVTRVNQYAPLGIEDSIVNTATISGGGITEVEVSETVTPVSGARLTITKSISPATVTENAPVTYTFTIQNTGNAPLTVVDTAAITDVLDPILTGLVVTFNGTTWSEDVNYTYSETTGQFETEPGQLTVPAATYTSDAETGAWIIDPGVSVLTMTGII